MTTAEPIQLRNPKATPWIELGGDGKPHASHDNATIPSHLLTNEQVKDLQQEVLRLRKKNMNRKTALRDLSYAMERKAHHLTAALGDRHDMVEKIEDLLIARKQMMERLSCQCR